MVSTFPLLPTVFSKEMGASGLTSLLTSELIAHYCSPMKTSFQELALEANCPG
jgi:hypothetical protein